MNHRYVTLLAASWLAGCGGGGGGGQPAPNQPAPPAQNPPANPSLAVSGAVQKGPFLVGSTVLINRLDSLGRSTASTIVSQVEDSIGSFDFVSTEPGPVQIVASGYYFSELTGQVSNGTLTLRALYQITAEPSRPPTSTCSRPDQRSRARLAFRRHGDAEQCHRAGRAGGACRVSACVAGYRGQHVLGPQHLQLVEHRLCRRRQRIPVGFVDGVLQVRGDEGRAVQHCNGRRAHVDLESALPRPGRRWRYR